MLIFRRAIPDRKTIIYMYFTQFSLLLCIIFLLYSPISNKEHKKGTSYMLQKQKLIVSHEK